ncbi:MAG: peptide-binding protein [Anditalea sp.]
MSKHFLFLNLIWVLVSFTGAAQNNNLYVSTSGSDDNPGTVNEPLATLQAAIKKTRDMPVKPEIILDKGTYYLNETVIFKPEDSGTAQNPLTIRAKEGERVIVSGGKRLDLIWEEYQNGRFKASTSGESFDQMFVNGEKQIRARYPNYDKNVRIFNGYAEDAVSSDRVKSWDDAAGGYLHAIHKHRWGGFHYIITGKEGDSLMMEGGWQNNRQMGIHDEYRFVENIFEELDAQMEWYHDEASKTLYYYPLGNINPNGAEIEITILENLFEFRGSEENPVQYIDIEGLELAHTRHTFMKTNEPLLRSDWTIHRGGGIVFDGAKNCRVSDCFFNSLGGNGIFVSNYNRDISITGCEMAFLGACAVSFVGNKDAVRSPSFEYHEYIPSADIDRTPGPKTNEYPARCKVEDCLIYNIGTIEKQVAGVQISMASEISVSHNTIYNVPRAGINIGDGTWGGHIIEYNDVFNTVLETGDHGAFNSWGRDRYWHPERSVMDSLVADEPSLIKLDAWKTTIIRNNRFHCDHGWDIDLDDGSSNYEIYNNVCLSGGIKLREGFYRKVFNNVLFNSTFHPHVWFMDSHDSFTRNILGAPYQPIMVKQWGDTVDFNLHPNKFSLEQAQELEIDENSAFGAPQFIDVKNGDFRITENSPALALGFENFSMEGFGVVSDRLKKKALSPTIPELVDYSNLDDKDAIIEWKGFLLKNLKGIAEMSATGMPDEKGVLVVGFKNKTKATEVGLQPNDVIVGINLWDRPEDEKINRVNDLEQFFYYYNQIPWVNELAFTIFRNQKEQYLKITR